MPGFVLNSSYNTVLKEIINTYKKQGGKKQEKKKIVRKRNIKNINSLEKNSKYLSEIMILFKNNLKTQKTKPKWNIIITKPMKINNCNKNIFLK